MRQIRGSKIEMVNYNKQMTFIIDKKLPLQAKDKLAAYGDILELETSGITYDAISGHPDIFSCPTPEGLVAAPKLPANVIRKLQSSGVKTIPGTAIPGKKYPQSAIYNALATEKYLIHNIKNTDDSITKACNSLEVIHVNQAYTRCNLVAMGNVFITSDAGIYKTLLQRGLDVHLFSSEDVLLQGFPHGFLGGACGVWGDKLFLCGSLKYFSEGERLGHLIKKSAYQLIELYEGPPVDGGGIIAIS